MTELRVLVEGQSEERFVRRVLAPHLDARCVWTTVIVVETSRAPDGGKRRGGGHWSKWRKDIARLLRDSRADLRVTTMFDLYGLPEDFPFPAHGLDDVDRHRRADVLEVAMAQAIGDSRFLPNLVRHEFEALVLAALPELRSLLDARQHRQGVDALAATIASMAPEAVDDGPTTAPSKRLAECIPGFGKLTHGVLAVELAGLVKLRAACPRFSAWVARIEQLGVVGEERRG